MELPTPEQLKAEKAERDSVLAELYLSKKENERLIDENKQLSPKVDKLKVEALNLEKQIEDRKKILSDISKHRLEITQLTKIKNELNNSILEAEKNIGMQSWVAQRDTLLKNVADLKIEEERLTKRIIELSDSITDLEGRINKYIGRIEEIDNIEKTKSDSIGKEVASLINQKSLLQVEIEKEKSELNSLISKKDTLIENIDTLSSIHDNVFEKVNAMDGIVGNVKDVSDKNISELREMFSQMESQIKDIIEKGKISSSNADVILEKLPKWIFELQKPGSIKKVRLERFVDRTLPEQNNKNN